MKVTNIFKNTTNDEKIYIYNLILLRLSKSKECIKDENDSNIRKTIS